MKCTLSKILIFAAGAATGSFVTWKILKTRYEQLMEAEVADIEERFASLYGADDEDEDEEAEDEPDEEDPSEPEPVYDRVVKDLGYSNSEVKGEVKPRVIDPNEFGEIEDYELITLIYYIDGVLTDDHDIPVEDVEGTVGKDSLNTFGEYEDDAVHVRNDRLHAYYEILLEMRNYHGEIAVDPPTEVK